jgi:hypothetical protein
MMVLAAAERVLAISEVIMKRVFRVLLAFALVVVVLLSCLPWLASTDMVRNRVVATVNKHLPGTLEVEEWSLGWLQGLSIKGVFYQDDAGNQFRVADLLIEKGLLDLAMNRRDLGRIEVTQPMAVVTLPEPREVPRDIPAEETSPLPEAQSGTVPEIAEKSGEVVPAAALPLPDYLAMLVVRGGSIAVVKKNGSTHSVLRDLSVDFALNGAGEPTTYQMRFGSGDAQGTMAIKGEAYLGTGPNLVAEEVELQAEVEMDALDLGALSILAGMADGVQMAGTLTGSFSVNGGLVEGLGLNGKLEFVDLVLAGSPLQGDRPDLGNVFIEMDGVFAREKITLPGLRLDSALTSLFASGEIGGDAQGEFAIKASVNLAEALSQFPETLGVQEGVTLEEGALTISGTVSRQGAISLVAGRAVVDRLRGIKDGQQLAWDIPVSMEITGAVGEDLLRLDRLQVDSSFLTAEGSGDLQRSVLKVQADLGTALSEMRKFVRLDSWDAGGQLSLNLRLEPGQEGSRAMHGELAIAEASLSRGGISLVPPGPVAMSFSSQLHLPKESEGLTVKATELSWQAWLGEAEMSIDHLVMPGASSAGDATLPVITGVDGSVRFNLALVGELLQRLELLDSALRLAGQAIVRTQASFDGNRLDLPQTEMEIVGLQVNSPDFPPIAEEKVVISLAAQLDRASGEVIVENLTLDSQPVSLKMQGDYVGDESGGGELNVDGRLALDLEALGAYLKDLLDRELVLEGKEEQPFTLQTSWTGAADEKLMARTEMRAGLSAERIEVFGLQMQSLTVPLQVSAGVARVDLSAAVNQGRLTLRPVIDYLESELKLVLEDPANILVDVQLTRALAEELLARIHPLFKGASEINGTLDLSMEEFSWPLDAALRDQQAAFRGVMLFNDLKLSSAGILGTILDLAKVSDMEMEIGDREIQFECVEGRITASPIRITVDGNEIELSGTIGLDQTLDYAALIPVTAKLVGADAFRYLEGTTIRLPIRGTLAKPDLGTEVFSSAVSDLTRQALQNAATKAIEQKAGKLLESLFK